ncbi:hypothetical protein CEXT_623431 [Caerostris extrusa]|uniref:Uncharacterized protein n=1 Tax=Caerostris extrusa TaxID=172846 RepID=A0AAV4P0G3_CAEEX|nr:hypothetical protein CEXT_623431 [Caerostris extrusa]
MKVMKGDEGDERYHPIIALAKFEQSNNFPTLLGLDWNPKLRTNLRANRITSKTKPSPGLDWNPKLATTLRANRITLNQTFPGNDQNPDHLNKALWMMFPAWILEADQP